MVVLVIGLGSMGKRRIRLIKQYDKSIEIVGVDSNADRTTAAETDFGIKTYTGIDEACRASKPDCAFVSTSPLSHCDIINTLIDRNVHTFTEINLVSNGYDRFVNEKKVKLFLSSTFLYRRDIQWMIQKVNGEKVNYIYHTGQYLPDWHPWESYKNYFVGDQRTNGCREMLAIELPWIESCFGKIMDFHVVKDKMTGLDLNYPDNYMIQFVHQSGSKGMMTVDVVARKAMRRIDIFNENLQIYWEGTPGSLQQYHIEKRKIEHISTYESIEKDKNYCDNIIENAYMDEIDAFFTWMKGDSEKVMYDFKRDQHILALIDQLEA